MHPLAEVGELPSPWDMDLSTFQNTEATPDGIDGVRVLSLQVQDILMQLPRYCCMHLML